MFHFKQFSIEDNDATMKIGNDAVMLGATATPGVTPRRILDVGTGCGVLALMMAQRFPTATVTAIDIDKRTIEVAASNFRNSPMSSRLIAINTSLQDYSLNNKGTFGTTTGSTTEDTTNASTIAITKATTEAPTHAITKATTEDTTEDTAEASTEDTTNTTTETPTIAITKATTEASTDCSGLNVPPVAETNVPPVAETNVPLRIWFKLML